MPEAGVGAVAAHHRTHAAQRQEAEVPFEEEARVAAEEPPALAERAGVGTHAALEDEALLEAVLERLDALDAETRTDVLARLHLKRRRGAEDREGEERGKGVLHHEVVGISGFEVEGEWKGRSAADGDGPTTAGLRPGGDV